MGRVSESVDGKIPRGTRLGTKWREGAFLLNWLGRILAELVKKRAQRSLRIQVEVSETSQGLNTKLAV